MKKNMRRWEAVLICMALLFSLFSLHTAEAKDEETLKTIFPVHVIHKTGDDKENWDCERLENNYLMAYVVNFTVPEYSEFGDIFIEGFGDSGALVRVDVEHVI